MSEGEKGQNKTAKISLYTVRIHFEYIYLCKMIYFGCIHSMHSQKNMSYYTYWSIFFLVSTLAFHNKWFKPTTQLKDLVSLKNQWKDGLVSGIYLWHLKEPYLSMAWMPDSRPILWNHTYTSRWRHMHDWNIISCNFKQQTQNLCWLIPLVTRMLKVSSGIWCRVSK